jgi:exopolysaccharide biosynthesis protein/predicted phosphodiesterase
MVGAVAAALLARGGIASAATRPAQGSPDGSFPFGPGHADPFRTDLAYSIPNYQTTVPGESVEADRVDTPVAPGIVLTSFSTFGRAGWLQAHVLNADLTNGSVGVDLLADKVSDLRTVSAAAAAQQAIAAVNGDYFDITETNAAEGPEIKDGVLRKGTTQQSTVATVGADRIARLADLMITGTVAVGATQAPLAALNSPSIPAGGIAVFTPVWGSGNRLDISVAGPYTELIVAGGTVTSVSSQRSNTPVPANGLVILACGASAATLATAKVGDTADVTFAPQASVTGDLHMALGSGSVLVKNGTAQTFPPTTDNTALKPRTAIAWLDGGTRLLLVAVDGSANFSAGLGFNDMAALLVRLGATDGFMLDGGGSTEIVSRYPGDSAVSVVNAPSDGNERAVANAVGLFGAQGSGQLRGLDVRPSADRVVPGLTMDVAVAGYDETWGPAEVTSPVTWRTRPGSLGQAKDGVFQARQPGAGELKASSAGYKGTHDLRVVGELHRLGFSVRGLTVDPSATAIVGITGYDADGFGAPVLPRDVTLDYDKTVITVTPTDDGQLVITGGANASGSASTLTATAQGVSVTIPVIVGLLSQSLAEFEPSDPLRWTLATARVKSASVAIVPAPDRPGASADNHALQLTYDFTGQGSTSAAYAVVSPVITLPSGTKKLSLWVKGDGKKHWLRAMMASQGTTNVPFTFAAVVDWTGWQQVVGDIPEGFTDPITLSRIYYVETSQSNKNAGQIQIDGLAALVGTVLDTTTPPQPDPYVIEQGDLPGDGRWNFAILSDLHISAAQTLNSFSGRQAVKSLQQVVAAKPDFILINGDFVDDDNAADFEMANGLLSQYVPDDLPVYWTPGNHEAGLSATGGIQEFLTVTGRPNRQIFDHKGTRFILLDSHTGDMRTSDWSQVPALQAALADAATDTSVTGVVVSFHHPLVDPTGTGASQLSDQLEASLFQQWLADFREKSGKSVALFTGHAHTAAVTRNDGVLEVTTPAVGKTPYASPDQGGFFGWMHVAVDPQPASITAGLPSPQTRDWLQAESVPLIDKITLSAPSQVAVGSSADVSASGITSEFGLTFPLRFPASVVWSGDAGLVVADSQDAVSAAKGSNETVAVLDLTTDKLTAVRPGTVTLTVASGGLTASATVTIA